jgi:acyl carrier protein
VDPEFVTVLRPFLKYADEQAITVDSRLRDLGLDSMRAIELLFAIEDQYDVVVPDDRLVESTFETCGTLWAMVEELRELQPQV